MLNFFKTFSVPRHCYNADRPRGDLSGDFYGASFCDERTIVNGIFGIVACHGYCDKSIELKRVLVV